MDSQVWWKTTTTTSTTKSPKDRKRNKTVEWRKPHTHNTLKRKTAGKISFFVLNNHLCIRNEHFIRIQLFLSSVLSVPPPQKKIIILMCNFYVRAFYFCIPLFKWVSCRRMYFFLFPIVAHCIIVRPMTTR